MLRIARPLLRSARVNFTAFEQQCATTTPFSKVQLAALPHLFEATKTIDDVPRRIRSVRSILRLIAASKQTPPGRPPRAVAAPLKKRTDEKTETDGVFHEKVLTLAGVPPGPNVNKRLNHIWVLTSSQRQMSTRKQIQMAARLLRKQLKLDKPHPASTAQEKTKTRHKGARKTVGKRMKKERKEKPTKQKRVKKAQVPAKPKKNRKTSAHGRIKARSTKKGKSKRAH